LAELKRDRKKRSKPFTPSDFMPRLKKKKTQTGMDMKKQAEMISRVLGGEVK